MPKRKNRARPPRPARPPVPPPTRRARIATKWKTWLTSAIAVAVIGAVAGAFATGFVNRLFSPPATSHTVVAAPQLEVDTTLVVPKIIQKAGRPGFVDQVYFSLRNTGNQLAVITGLRLEVQRFLSLKECFSSGSLLTTGWSQASLPVDPKLGTVVTVPQSQQLTPDSADKFEVSLHVNTVIRGLQIYRLHAWVLYDKQATPVNAGYLVVSLPVEPQDGGYVWTRQDQADPGRLRPFTASLQQLSQCLIANSKQLRTILSLPGNRSTGLSGLPAQLAYRY
jgi:hypothetical protein